MARKNPKRGTLRIEFGSYGTASDVSRSRTAHRLRAGHAAKVRVTELLPGDLVAFVHDSRHQTYGEMIDAGGIAELLPVTGVSEN